MKTRSVVLLIVVALFVGAAIVYVFVREPERPTSPPAPKPWFDMPAAPARTPNTSDSYKRAPSQAAQPSTAPADEED